MRRVLIALLIVAASAGVASPSHAQEAPAKPRAEIAATHFRRGVELYDEADFATALVEFKRAYETQPEFRVLYNIGQAEYQLQHYAQALAAFRRYLDEGAANVSPVRRAEVEREIAKLEGRVARIRVEVDRAADVFVDEDPAVRAPLSTPLIVSAGRHRVRVVAPGSAPFERTLELAGGDDVQLKVPLGAPAPAPAPAPTSEATASAPPPPASESKPIDPAVLVWTGTGVVAIAAVATGVAALSASSDLEDEKRKPPGAVTRTKLDEAADRAKTLALVTDVLGGVAIVGAGVGLYLTFKPSPRSATAVRIEPRGSGVSLSGAF